MSKYDELAQSYSRARKSFRDYEEVCRNFARDLIFGMVEYFEWPRDREITYIPIGEELDPNNKFYALAGAMRMDAQSFWHFGVELNVMEASGAYPLSLVLSFFIKKAGSNFIVKLGPNGREIKIPEEKQDQLAPLYDVVFRQIKDFLAKQYIHAITSQEKEYGFITIL
jgi:hypothetical protein